VVAIGQLTGWLAGYGEESRHYTALPPAVFCTSALLHFCTSALLHFHCAVTYGYIARRRLLWWLMKPPRGRLEGYNGVISSDGSPEGQARGLLWRDRREREQLLKGGGAW